MTLVCPDAGERKLLADLLGTGNNWTLELYKADVTPAESDTLATYTVCDFTGYAAKTLTRAVAAGNWGTPATNTGVTSSQYNSGTPQTFTCTGATGNTAYGYLVKDGVAGVLLWAEKFATARNLAENDTLSLTPTLQLD